MKLASAFTMVLMGLGSAQAFGSDGSARSNGPDRHGDRPPRHVERDTHDREHHTRYTVLYRGHHDHHWRVHSRYRTREAADHAAHDLGHHGRHVRVTID